MELILVVASSSLLVLIITHAIFKSITTKRIGYTNLPPYPSPPLPLLGHLHLLKQPPPTHRTLHKLSLKHGPIFSLKFGSRLVVVISSADLAEETLSKNAVVFADRPRLLVHKYIGYDHTALSACNYGDHYRLLRRTIVQELLGQAQLNARSDIREDEIRKFLLRMVKTTDVVSHDHRGFTKVVLRSWLSELLFDTVLRMVAGSGCFNVEQGKDFQRLISKVFELGHSANPEDFLPFLLWADFRGVEKSLSDLGKDLDRYYQMLLDKQRAEKIKDTIIGHLLSLQESEPEFYTDKIIKGLIMNMIVAATETTYVTLEWGMSVLLNHPDALNKARSELDAQISNPHHRLITEGDLPNLPFLRCIIYETLRLFPPGPLLLPHASSQDCKIRGYDIPRGTMLLVNSWAIHRDSNSWEDDPTSFKPERFEGLNKDQIDTKKMMPFGLGRRSCPGSNLGSRMLGLVLGALIQCFDWERVGLEPVDLSEGIGLTSCKLEPLEAMCKPREIVYEDLSQ